MPPLQPETLNSVKPPRKTISFVLENAGNDGKGGEYYVKEGC